MQLREVGPRDGLQNEQQVLPVETRLELIRRLAGTGLRRIEAASFVNPERVPRMAGAEEVAAGLDSGDGILYTGLALNERGYDRLRETGLGEVSFALAATETFSQRNAGASVEDSVAAGERIVSRAPEDGIRSSVTISVAFGCPFEGPVDPDRVVALAERVVAAGPDELVLADTIGVATPTQARRLLERVGALGTPVGGHFHNTRNTGFANAYTALEAGVSLLDASVGGLGGCPFAPKATGNVATEDLVYLLEGEGVATGVDLDRLIEVPQWLEELLGRQLEGYVYRAGPFRTRA
ncbi:MAG TPA: hydroxymethylglutaryl-CoA lyase [Gaiellaceae bacterium]|nr:hydroxymethylglutaryl-CoA lyase [Gaiellaceae bacterium]